MHMAADINPADVVSAMPAAAAMELEQIITHRMTSFAYPFGYHSARARNVIRSAGFDQACALGDLPARRGDDRWALPRLQVSSTPPPRR